MVEVMVVVGIILVLVGLTVVVTGPVREYGRQTTCASNLRQLHQAVLMYTSAYDNVEEIIGLGEMSAQVARGGLNALKPYVKNPDEFFCPDLPASMKPKLGTSYIWYPVPNDAFQSPSPNEVGMITKQTAEIERMGVKYPMWVCKMHDEVYYQPRESEIDDVFAQPFVVEISVGGSIYRGRRPYSRSSTIKAFQNLP